MTDGGLVAALPMYDWPECTDEVDRFWDRLGSHLRDRGIPAPGRLARRNADLPSVPGGIRNAAGEVIAPDPATLDPDGFDLAVVWRHPALLFGQTCWGPMETGLEPHVSVIGQPDYSGFEGGAGPYYSSVVIMNERVPGVAETDLPAPADGRAVLPLDLLAGKRLAYNEIASRSGYRALSADLAASGRGMDLFESTIETHGHRKSIRAVAEGRAECAAIDCRSWALARRFEPAAARVRVVGWTARRPGLPYISSRVLAGRFPDAFARAPLDLA